MNPYQVVKDFERAVAEYTGAPFAVSVMSCTAALLLAVAWKLRQTLGWPFDCPYESRSGVSIPKRTYVSVPMSIIHAGGRPTFRDEEWSGGYELRPLGVWDYARRFTGGMYKRGELQCVSFHWSKILGIQQGGAILTDDYYAYEWLKKARFDGRTEGVPVAMDQIDFVGWHYYMSPEIAAEGLQRIGLLPKTNADLPLDNYPDLSTLRIFQ